MAYATTVIKYGWRILVGIALTGATIYTLTPTRRHVLPCDAVEVVVGTHEKYLAAGLTPPSYIRTWTSNVYSSTGVTTYSETMTNTFGNYIDYSMMTNTQAAIKAVVPHFYNINNLSALTFTGLLASLHIGDGTNFTRVPAIGTNPATYGVLPHQIFITNLQEMYMVLNALEYTLAGAPSTTSNYYGRREDAEGTKSPQDLIGYSYSNKTTSAIVLGYREAWQASAIGMQPDIYSGDTNYTDLGTSGLYSVAWTQVTAMARFAWYYGVTNTYPYQIHTNYYEIEEESGFAAGYVGNSVSTRKNWQFQGSEGWVYSIYPEKAYSTWQWEYVPVDGLTYGILVFAKPVYSIANWSFDTNLNQSISNEFQEMAGMTDTNVYYQIDGAYINTTTSGFEIVFGSDEFAALKLAGSIPSVWVDEPTIDGERLVKGCILKPANSLTFKQWQFTYCTNKFW